MALRTRSRASSMALLPRPTICRAGRPFVMSLSTSIIWPANPTGATDLIFATLFMLFIVKHIGGVCANCFGELSGVHPFLVLARSSTTSSDGA